MKKEIRKEIIKNRDLLTSTEIREKSSLIRSKLFNMKEYIESESIFCFLTFGSELETDEIIKDALEKKKKVYVPYINKEEDVMYAVEIENMDDFELNKFGIREPRRERFYFERVIHNPDPVENPRILEASPLVLVPGVAFDRKGFRVGYGKGYYDRFFHTFPVKSKIALAFGLQLIDHVPAQEHDQSVDMILTENELIRIL